MSTTPPTPPAQAVASPVHLPVEVWARIIGIVQEEEGIPQSEMWQLHPPEHYTHNSYGKVRRIAEPYPGTIRPRLSSLRAISQTCRTFSVICAPLLWRHIGLNLALSRRQVLGQVESVSIIMSEDVDWLPRLSELSLDPKAAWSEDRLYYGRHFPDMEDFQREVDTLGQRLGACPNLFFEWEGFYRPWNPFYNNLAKAPRLQAISLGLTIYHIPNSTISRSGAYPPQPDDFGPLASRVHTAMLAFGCVSPIDRYDRLVDYTDVREACPGLYRWLHGENEVRHLYLAAPILLFQPWLVPLWAQAISIFIDNGRGLWGVGERLLNTDEDLAACAAQRFRARLVAFEKQKRHEHDKVEPGSVLATIPTRELTSRDVYDIIMSEEAFEEWREWFPSWESGETQAIMERVVEFKHRGDTFALEEPDYRNRQAMALVGKYEQVEAEDPLAYDPRYSFPYSWQNWQYCGRLHSADELEAFPLQF